MGERPKPRGQNGRGFPPCSPAGLNNARAWPDGPPSPGQKHERTNQQKRRWMLGRRKRRPPMRWKTPPGAHAHPPRSRQGRHNYNRRARPPPRNAARRWKDPESRRTPLPSASALFASAWGEAHELEPAEPPPIRPTTPGYLQGSSRIKNNRRRSDPWHRRGTRSAPIGRSIGTSADSQSHSETEEQMPKRNPGVPARSARKARGRDDAGIDEEYQRRNVSSACVLLPPAERGSPNRTAMRTA